ncbi:MAG: response regulator transcription factor [Nitrolancea sp.]
MKGDDERPIRVVLADDHPLFREGVAALIARTSDIVLVAEAGTGEDVLRLVDEHSPDLVLMDLKMPGMGGVEATRRLVEGHPDVGVIILTMSEEDDTVFSALRAGARSYVLKDADRGTLLRAIRAAVRNEVLLSSTIARRVIGGMDSPAERLRPLTDPMPDTFDRLTPREVDVLRLIAHGLRNREIADRLYISEKTVGNHISSIFSKLDIDDRSQAILLALRNGLGESEP